MTTVKITELSDIGANLATSTVVPVVNMAGTPTTQKTNIGNIANIILEGAGVDYPEASVALLAQTVSNAAQPNITSVGTLTNVVVSGNATVNGNITSNGTAYVGNLSTTGLASITTLSVGATANLGAVGNVKITGGTAGQVLSTDGAGNLSWASDSGGNYGNSNVVSLLSAYGSNTITTTGNVSVGNIVATGISSVANFAIVTDNANTDQTWTFGANGRMTFPSGMVIEGVTIPQTATALIDSNGISIATSYGNAIQAEPGNITIVSNLQSWHFTGDGNLSLPGNTFAVNYANGTPVSLGGGYDNSNVATFLAAYGSNTITTTGNVSVGNIIGNGQALTGIAGANVSGFVPNANVANTAFAVAAANVTGLGNIATINLTGSTSNVLYGNGVFAPAAGGGNSSELVNGNNSFVLDSAGNVVFEGTPSGNAVDRGLVWDYGANANGVNSQIRQDLNGLTVRAWTENAGNYTAPVNIITGQDANTNTWRFDGQGNLTVPSGSIKSINDGGQLGAYVTLTPDLGLARLAGRSSEYTQNFNSGGWTSASYTGTQVDIVDAPNLLGFVSNNTIFTSAVDRTFSINGGEPVPYTGYGASGNNVTLYTDITADPDPTVVTSIDFYYQSESFVAIDYDDGTLNINATGLTINLDNDQTSGPDINLRSGDDILLQAKDKALGSESEGGDINIYAGDGADDDGAGNTSSTGGDIQITAGNGGDGNSSSGSTGGFTAISGGLGGAAGVTNTAGPGGYVSISGGDGGNDGGNTSLGAGGGNVSITAGLSTQEGVNGPNVFIGSGQGGPNALSGSVVISTPASVDGPGGDWVFDGYGNLILPNNSNIATIGNVTQFNTCSNGFLGLNSYDANGNNIASIAINSIDGLVGISTYDPITDSDYHWAFDVTGNLTLPGNTFAVNYANGTQVSLGSAALGNLTVDNVTLQGINGGLNLSAGSDFTANLAYLQVRAGDVASHIHLDTGNNQAYDLIVGDDQNYVQVSSTGNILLSSYDSNTAQYTWTLDYNGNLILAGGNSVIQSIANSSLDPTLPNVSTMVLTPDANYNSQVLVLDPTAPGHIHLRAYAFSNIDEPAANIFLGGEDTAFEITSGANNQAVIHSNGKAWTFGNDGNISSDTLTFTTTFANVKTVEYQTAGVWDLYVEDGITGSNTASSRLNVSFKDNLIDKPQVYIENTKESDGIALRWTFDENGNLNFPRDVAGNSDPYLSIFGGSTPTIQSTDVSLAGPANLAIQSNYLNLSGFSGDKIVFYADTGEMATDANMTLTTNLANTGNTSSWTFSDDGLLTLPGGNVVIGSLLGSEAILASNIAFGVVSQGNGSTVLQWIDDVSNASALSAIYINSPSGNTGDVVVLTGEPGANANIWTFGNNGNLTLPTGGQIIVSGGLVSSGASPAPTINGFSITNSVGISGNGNIAGNNISATGNVTAQGVGTNMVRRANTISGSNTVVTLDNLNAYVGGTPKRLYIGAASSNMTMAGQSQTMSTGALAVSSWINVPIVTGTGNGFAMSGAITNDGDTAVLNVTDQGAGSGTWRVTGMIANTSANLYSVSIERLA